jgi:type 1 glutamine amidotransferase
MIRILWIALAAALASGLAGGGVDRPDPANTDGEPVRVLIFSRTAGFRHGSIPHGVDVVSALPGVEATATEDPAVFTPERLGVFDVVVFLNTTGDVLDETQQKAFEQFIGGGKGFVGIHAASDTEYDWPWYGRLVGAYFKGHPAVQTARIRVLDRDHAATAHLDATWERRDEWYDFRGVPSGVRVLLELDESSYEGGTMGSRHPIAWCHEFDGGRAFYTGGGHTSEAFDEPAFRRHLAGAIAWAAKRDPAPEPRPRP